MKLSFACTIPNKVKYSEFLWNSEIVCACLKVRSVILFSKFVCDMSKSRREVFEDQLRALQDDISKLSKKLGASNNIDQQGMYYLFPP